MTELDEVRSQLAAEQAAHARFVQRISRALGDYTGSFEDACIARLAERDQLKRQVEDALGERNAAMVGRTNALSENAALWSALAAESRVLSDILAERIRQNKLKAQGKFRRTCADDMSNPERLSVLAEEFGEVARCVFEGIDGPLDREHLREELVQVAAVCMAWVEGLDT